MSGAAFGLVVSVLLTAFVVAMVLAFERRRARGIERDLRDHGRRPHDDRVADERSADGREPGQDQA